MDSQYNTHIQKDAGAEKRATFHTVSTLENKILPISQESG